MDEAIKRLETTAARLAGARLDAVRYYTLPPDPDDEWDMGVAHVLEFGLDLVTDRGTFGVTWTADEGAEYGLQIVPEPLDASLWGEHRVLKVDDSIPWASLLGGVVERPIVRWGTAEVEAPFALDLGFEGGSHVVVAVGYWQDVGQPVYLGGDDVVVVWDQAAVSRLLPQLD
ncbi:MAG TPA: hypothetical protein VGS21_00265 [Acidimicrobiales bacterium]|nr:hypothetical protein [Acidimicrobiales bacterium]